MPVIALLCPAVAIFAHKGMVIILFLIAIAAIIDFFRCRGLGSPFGLMLTIAAIGMLAWAATSSWWEATPGLALSKSAQLCGLIALGGLGFAAARRLPLQAAFRTEKALAIGLALASLGVLLDRATACGISGPLDSLRGVFQEHCLYFRYKAGAAVLAAVLPPVLARQWMRGQRYTSIILAILVAGAIIAAGAHTVLVACSFGAALYLLARYTLASATVVFSTLLAFAILLAPLVFSQLPTSQEATERWHAFPTSLSHRLVIWQFVNEKIAERPVLGWGMDASRELPDAEQQRPVYMMLDQRLGVVGYPQPVLPLHPHNFGLQVWLELGGVGAALVLALLLASSWRIIRYSDQRLTPALIANLGIIAVVGLASFGAWQSWWLAAVWISATLAATLDRASRTS